MRMLKMRRKVYIPEHAVLAIAINERKEKKALPPYEADEFTIGCEGGGPGAYYHIAENAEDEVEDSEVDLSSFRRRDEMAGIWDNGMLDSRVRLALLDIADDFWSGLEVDWVKPEDIVLMGSICNYNWSRFSDIDLHIIVDFSKVDDKTDFVKEYFDAKKSEWNNKHGENLKIHGFPIEIYVQDVGEENASNAVYSLETNEWIKAPDKSQIGRLGLDKYDIKRLAAKIMTRIDDISDAFEGGDKHAAEATLRKCERLKKAIRNMRKISLEEEGEMGVGNIAFKVLRRTGYMEKLSNLKDAAYDAVNSI